MTRHQEGTLFVNGDTCYLKYRITELKDGTPQRVHKTIRLCDKSDLYTWWKKKGKWGFSSAVHDLRRETMDGLRTEIERAEPSNGDARDMTVVDFWEQRYLPYCEREWKGTGMKRSTLRSFKQVWRQHLKNHFADLTVQTYTPDIARRFLASLKTKQGKNTLKHIRALASAMFSEAIERDLRKDANPWHLKLPKDCRESKPTEHYTLEEAEDMITALVDHVDAQLVLALSCFLGLGPAEIGGLQWGDIDAIWIHVRRNKVRGDVVTPKTPERMAKVPIIDQVRVPLELWRAKCDDTGDAAFVIADLPNLINRVIKTHISGENNRAKLKACARCKVVPKASSVTWKGLYAGRRGACTAVIEATGGNYAVAQALLRHKSMTTTLNVYKKQITPDAFKAGMKLLEAAANSGK